MSTLKYFNMAYALTLVAVLHGMAFCVAGCWPFWDDSEPDHYGGPDSGYDTDTDTDSDFTNGGNYPGDYTINTQWDVAFFAGYTSISGYLIIECPSCTDLSELICLTSVGGTLRIKDNISLHNLEGLSSLTSVGDLSIYDNDFLTNLDGLSALTSVGEILDIWNNDVLTNLDGLSALISMGPDFWIEDNNLLPDCEVCDLLDQFTAGPTTITVLTNFDDSCTPVPANCPGPDAGVDGGP